MFPRILAAVSASVRKAPTLRIEFRNDAAPDITAQTSYASTFDTIMSLTPESRGFQGLAATVKKLCGGKKK